ncbi:MAG: phage portal protein [Hyphomicrobiaceae bacterium]
MAPALQVARQFDQLADATLMAAIVQTLFAVTITSDEPTEQVLAGLLTPQEQAKMLADGISRWRPTSRWWPLRWQHARRWHQWAARPPLSGQELKFHNANHPAPTYKDFSLHLLRELARCLGLTYERDGRQRRGDL